MEETAKQPITIPSQIVDSGAKFVLVKKGSKEGFEDDWQKHPYSANDQKLARHISNGGNYGILAHGIGTIDVDHFDKWIDCGFKKLPDTFTDSREGKRFHVFFKCDEVPDEFRGQKIGMKFGDIRLPGHDSYVVGTNSVAYRTKGDPTQIPYEIFNPSPVKSISWEAIHEIIKRGRIGGSGEGEGDSIGSINAKKSNFKITGDTPEGNREPTLHKLVWSLATKGLMISSIEAACIVENRNFSKPHTDDEVKRIVLKSYQSWIAKSQVDTEKKARMMKAALPDDPLAEYSEIRVAEKFCEHLQGNYLFNGNTRQWHHWTGTVWEIDKRETLKTEYAVFARLLYTKLSSLQSDTRIKAFQRIQFFNSSNGCDHVIKIASHMLFKLTEDFDQNNDYLNVLNGTIEFNGDEIVLREHCKEDYLSHICNVEYNPETPIPEIWTNHINTVMIGDQGLIDNLQFLLGYSLQGGNPLERFTFLTGTGRNGKSVTFRTYAHILGDYALEVNPLTLMEAGNKTNSPERKMMKGKRFIFAQETKKTTDKENDRCNIDTGFLKACSGRDAVSFRDNHGNILDTFYVLGQICLSTNNLPKVEDTTTSFWDRIILIPFNRYFPDEERNENLGEEMKRVSSGIFNWCLEGWKMYRKTRKFVPCEAVREKIEDYQSEADEYALFVRDVVERNGSSHVGCRELFVTYLAWCKARSITLTKSETQFGKDFKSRYPKKRTMVGMSYLGIMLKNFI